MKKKSLIQLMIGVLLLMFGVNSSASAQQSEEFTMFDDQRECNCEAVFVCGADGIREFFSGSADTATSCVRNLVKVKSYATGCEQSFIDKSTVKYACGQRPDLSCASGQGERFCDSLSEFRELLTLGCGENCDQHLKKIHQSIDNLEFWHRFIADNDLGISLDLAEQARKVNDFICSSQEFKIGMSRKDATKELEHLAYRATSAQGLLANLQLLGDLDFIRECRGLDSYTDSFGIPNN